MSSPTITDVVCNKCCMIIDAERSVKCKLCNGNFHIYCSNIATNKTEITECTVYTCNGCVSGSNDAKNATIPLLSKTLKDNEYHKSPKLGIRHVQALLLFLCVLCMYLSRLTVSVAVVAMTNAETANPDFPEFDWSEKEISYILSSFFWGYICTQFPGGILCKRYGARNVMGLSMSILTLLIVVTPWTVGWGGWQVFCAIRVLQGLTQGVLYPCVFEHLAKWSPQKERNRLGGFTLTAVDSGTVLAMGISGIIAEGPMGWPGISYVVAGICFVWCVLWFILGANNPCESRFITQAEKQFIEVSLAHEEGFHNKKIPIPWKAIWTSLPFFAFIIARSSGIYSLSTFQSQMPSYFHGVLNMKIKANGLLSAMPFMASLLMSYIYVALADYLQRKNLVSLRVVRKSFNSVAYCIPAIGLLILGFLDETHKIWALIVMTVNVALCSCDIIGSALNAIDLAPNHAGLLVSFSQTATSGTSLISPLVVGAIVTDVTSRSQWQIIFATCAAVYFVGNLVYVMFGSTDTQPWNAEDYLLTNGMETSSASHKNGVKMSSVKEVSVKYKAES